ncbi:MAG TPA: MFS transporter [Acidimicrobiia bacterium]|nr:MFS transporter [Acidimicrobiia bacterium]
MTSVQGSGPLTNRGRHLANQPGLGSRFRSLYLGTAVSLLGNYVAYLTIPLLVVEILGSADTALPFSITYALETVPTLVFGLVGGVVLDRVSLRWAMVLADIARAAAFFYLAWSVPGFDLPTVFAASFLIGSFSAVYENALYALIPALVPEERLAQANGRIAATQAAMFAAGPLIAGAMATIAGPRPGLYFNGATFVVSAVGVFLVGPVPPRESEEERGGFVEETLNGLRYLIGEKRLRDSTITAAAANLVLGFVEATFVVMASVVLMTETDTQIGVLIAACGLGMTSGAALADRVIRIFGLGRTMMIGLLTIGVGMVLLVFSRFGTLALIFAFVMFVGIGLVNVPIATIRQVYTPPAMLGRVITASRALSWGTLPIGALLGGFLAHQVSYVPIARATPLVLLALAGWLLTTPLWSDTFGPTHRRRLWSGSPEERKNHSDEEDADTTDHHMQGV